MPPTASPPPTFSEGPAVSGDERSPPESAVGGAATGPLAGELRQLLSRRLGFDDYRVHQEDCCLAVAQGRDVLLVMPTGAGKSLCYQLPGLYRPGGTLVVSPLIALIDDQVEKLKAQGVRAVGMHSGLERQELLDAAQEWRRGDLEFLFVAPERLARAGWRALLEERPPGLVAIDEAHCISQWGHDFRPDYRRLREWLGGLRPAPCVALTATATPRVQEDIVAQLDLRDPLRFIHGFRRSNLAIEVLQVTPGRRLEAIDLLLREPENRPALVYCGTRRETEELASTWGDLAPDGCRVAPYHAGLDATARESVLKRFLAGDLDVVFATVAFGMGVDKADVRTVVHSGLPGTLEGYYQEIGRAGRDGEPSRAVLLTSPIDRRMHDFFLERDYPEIELLRSALRRLPAEGPTHRDELLAKVSEGERDEVENCLDKLLVHGAIRRRGDLIERADAPGRGRTPSWVGSYREQRDHRAQQIEEMVRFTRSSGCRMGAVVRHFGERSEDRECGICDACTGSGALSSERPLEEEERQIAEELLRTLQTRALATGRAYREVARERIDRDAWRALIEALRRERLLRVREHSFERDGETIRYQRMELTHPGRRALAADADLGAIRVAGSMLPRAKASASRGRGGAKSGGSRSSVELPASGLTERLKSWRSAESRRRKVPAYVVLSNAALAGISTARPADQRQLLAVNGVGAKTVELYGDQLIALVAEDDPGSGEAS